MSEDVPARLRAALADCSEQLRALAAQREEIVAASQDSNADDEHDPEGATIAFERQQIAALLDQLERSRADIERALALHESGTYGRCERCGEPIGAARLDARPTARTCIACAGRRR